jgi:2-polyprenyl-3-methyl-5-hydroxy-6-metoxy-1,4-benzoquinol methylase
LSEEFLREGSPTSQIVLFEHKEKFTVGEALVRTGSEFTGIVFDDVIFWDPAGWQGLCRVLDSAPQVALVAPVSNEAAVAEQRAVVPFAYHTPSLFRFACHSRRQQHFGHWQEVRTVDPFAFLCRRADLAQVDPHLPLTQLPTLFSAQGRVLAVTHDTYVHRYGQMYEQPRADLQAWVPMDAHHILDIGCAAGALGAALQERQRCQVVGIELNPTLAEGAIRRLDRVLQQSVEDLPVATFTAEFDCIICGDVLEHLRDPWSMIEKITHWLKPQGRFIVTVPNVGHWSIAADLLHGRWDLVPFSLLCWSHLRFFTRAGVEQLMRGHGLFIEHLRGREDPLPPVGETFLQKIGTVITDADLASLRTSEFLLVARKGTT